MSVSCHIILNQIATEVSENLYDALSYLYTRLRASGHLIWIDALCIDQHNLAERSSQVLHMRSIYEQADSVWIWLGVPFDDVENNMAVQKMKHLHTVLMNAMDVTDKNVVGALSMIRSDDPLIFPEPGTDCYRAWQGIMRLCELTWWKRAWVYQEATSPNEKSRLFFSGQACFGWEDVFAATEIAGHLGKITDLDRKFVQIISEGSAERIWKFVLRREKTEKLGLLEALQRFRLTDSTEPRDKVYAPRCLVDDLLDDSLVPDYTKSVKEVFLDVVKASIAHPERALDFLGYCVRAAEDSLVFKDLYSASIPSWIPDWRDRYAILPFPKQKKGQSTSTSSSSPDQLRAIYNASGHRSANLRIEGDTLKTQGFLVDSINQLSPIWDKNVQDTFHLKSWTPGNPNDTYHTGETILQAFLRTVVGDVFWDNKGTCSRGFSLDWSFLETKQFDPVEALQQQRMAASANGISSGRRIGQTSKGYMGLVPAAARLGDRIVLIFGGSVLYVLRPREGLLASQYEFVGECYIHGLMDGEVLDWEMDQMGSEIILV